MQPDRALEPAVQAHLDAQGLVGFEQADKPTQRRLLTAEIDRMFELFGEPGPEVAAVREHTLASRDAGRTVRARSYHPVADGVARPGHLILHGGGWAMGSIVELVADATSRHRAVSADCVVVGIDYALAPEFRFPAAVYDVVDAIAWMRAHADELGIDPRVITVGGASAGANLAAGAILADPTLDLAGLVLEVPLLDMRPSSMAGAGEDVLAQLYDVLDTYLGPTRHDLASSPLASPLAAEDLSGFPPTHIATAELDPLHPHGSAFAAALEAAGIPVTVREYAGALHGSGILTRTWPTARRWHDEVLAALTDFHARATV